MSAHLSESMACCGCDEIHGIEDGETPVEQVANVYRNWARYRHGIGDGNVNNGPPILVFTEAVRYSHSRRNTPGKCGVALEAFIKTHKLGTVVKSGLKINPNTTNKVRAWLWTVSARQFHAWAKKQDWYPDWHHEASREEAYDPYW